MMVFTIDTLVWLGWVLHNQRFPTIPDLAAQCTVGSHCRNFLIRNEIYFISRELVNKFKFKATLLIQK